MKIFVCKKKGGPLKYATPTNVVAFATSLPSTQESSPSSLTLATCLNT
jgi:hypothetical protein